MDRYLEIKHSKKKIKLLIWRITHNGLPTMDQKLYALLIVWINFIYFLECPFACTIWFCTMVVKLNGYSSSTVSDHDPIFVSGFWKNLFELVAPLYGTKYRRTDVECWVFQGILYQVITWNYSVNNFSSIPWKIISGNFE